MSKQGVLCFAMIAAYLRVSTAQQKHDSQRADIERWLSGHGHDPASIEWFIDTESRRHLDRPALKRLQAAIFNGEVKTVVIWKLDRLSGNLRDGVNIVADWCKQNVRLVAVQQQLDLSDKIGEIIAAVLFGIAAIELESIKERRDAGIAVAKARGVYKGGKKGALWRYREIPTSEGEKVDRVAEAAKLRKTGNSYAHICRYLDIAHPTLKKYLSLAADEGLIPADRI